MSGSFKGQQQPYFTRFADKMRFYLTPSHWFYFAIAGLCRLIALLPYRTLLKLGEVFGRICYATGRKYRHIVEVNLRLCFPELDAEQRYQLLQRYFRSAGVGAMEVIMSFWMPKRHARHLLQVQGLEHLIAAYEQGQGVILLSAHFTMLELCMRLSCEQIDLPLHLVYKKQKNPFFNYLWVQSRRRFVDKLIAHDDIRGMLSSLRKGQILCYVPDQDFGRKYEHVFAPFFGTPAATITSTSRLAQRTHSPVIMVNYIRLPDAKGYQVTFSKPLAGFPTGDCQQDAALINQQVEAAIRQNPEQYFWHHRRFKTRPPGEAKLYQKMRRKYI